jgi:hypothetical protein
MRGRERVERQDVGLGALEHGRDLAERAVEMRDGLTQRVACLKERVALKVGRIRAARRPR